MATQYTSLLGLALPVTGELSGSWGDVVNTSITSLLDSAISGTTSLTTDADVTLTTTTGAANEARQAIILWNPASGTVTRNITAPAQSKIYTVINASGGTQSIVFRGAGPTTGVTIIKGESAVVAWNGTDFIKISNTGGGGSFTNVTISGTTTLSGLTASTALALNASKEVVSVTNTGTGNNVLATSPTLVTPALGTPSSATLTNATGLPISTGVSGLGAGVATFLATPSSANLAAAVTDETGSGALVFATSPTLVTPALGTPSSVTLTNATGLPISTGVSGLGTGVATALAVNVGTAGSPVINGGVLGTPSSGTLTNATGLPISTGVSGLGTGIATALAVNVGSAGAPVLFNGALGTPSSGTVTNLTGTASININGTVGATTPTTGAFTTVNNSGGVRFNTSGTEYARMQLNGTSLEVMAGSASVAGLTLNSSNVATLTNNPVLTAGTANGVAYLNGSKVLTTGSALTFDGTTLTSPQFYQKQTLSATYNTQVLENSASNGYSQFQFNVGAGGANGQASISYAPGIFFALGPVANDTTTPMVFRVNNGSEQMRLTSTGLGIGTSSPAYKLDVAGTINSGASSATGYNLVFRTSGITTGRAQAALTNTSGDFYTGIEGSTAGATLTGSAAYSAFAGTFTNNPLYLVTNGVIRTTLDSSGNLGLGVTPSASWTGTQGPAMQIGQFASVFNNQSIGSSEFAYNTARTGSNTYAYANSSVAASRLQQRDGAFNFFTAPSGTAGNAISFTQAMTLDASGNLGVGSTSPVGYTGYKGISLNGTNGGHLTIQNSGSGAFELAAGSTETYIKTISSTPLTFGTANTERARITSSGYFKASNNGTYGAVAASFHELNQSASDQGALVLYGNNASTTAAGMLFIETARNTTNNTYYAISYYNSGAAAYKFRVADSGNVTNTNNSYGAISDAKLKENVTDATPKLEKLQQVRVVNYNLIGEDQKQLGVIAQELEQIFPGMVDESPDRDREGNNLGTTTKSVKYSVFVPMLIKAMQEQQAIIESLKARLDAANL